MDVSSAHVMVATDNVNYIAAVGAGGDNFGVLFYYDGATLQFVQAAFEVSFPCSIGMFFQDDYWGAATKAPTDLYWNASIVLPSQGWNDFDIYPPDTIDSFVFFGQADPGATLMDNFIMRTDNPLQTSQNTNFRTTYTQDLIQRSTVVSRAFMGPRQ
jgi:hypothetical protein